VKKTSERVAEMQCGKGTDDGKQKRGDAGVHDTPTGWLRGFELLRA